MPDADLLPASLPGQAASPRLLAIPIRRGYVPCSYLTERRCQMTGGGCLKTVQVNPGEPVGTDWTDIVQDIMRRGVERASEHLETQENAGEGEVMVRIEMSAYLRFPYDGGEFSSGSVTCVCTNDGTVCVCSGQCDFDACCDEAPPPGPIIIA
jgi:hypothetical protein